MSNIKVFVDCVEVDLNKINDMPLKDLIKIMSNLDLCFKGVGNGRIKLMSVLK